MSPGRPDADRRVDAGCFHRPDHGPGLDGIQTVRDWSVLRALASGLDRPCYRALWRILLPISARWQPAVCFREPSDAEMPVRRSADVPPCA